MTVDSEYVAIVGCAAKIICKADHGDDALFRSAQAFLTAEFEAWTNNAYDRGHGAEESDDPASSDVGDDDE